LLDAKIGLIITVFLAIFFGVFTTPLDLFSKLIIDAIDTIVFSATIIVYIHWKRKLHWKTVFYSGGNSKYKWLFVMVVLIVAILIIFHTFHLFFAFFF